MTLEGMLGGARGPGEGPVAFLVGRRATQNRNGMNRLVRSM
jgi:hypothetical protein